MLISRRRAVLSLAAAAVFVSKTDAGRAASLPPITVTKDPNCSCCTGWVQHLEKAGFPVTVVTATNLKATKARLGVPDDLSSCHTAELGAYVIEGHVPADAIRRLLDEKPQAIGLAVPGMPAGSPGMGGEPEAYEVILFSSTERRAYGRYRADQSL